MNAPSTINAAPVPRSTMSLVRRMGSLQDISRALQIADAAAQSQKTGQRVSTAMTCSGSALRFEGGDY